jgi:hypothetical protein
LLSGISSFKIILLSAITYPVYTLYIPERPKGNVCTRTEGNTLHCHILLL